MQNLLLEMSKQFAPKMKDQYHWEFVRIAMDILRIHQQKSKARLRHGLNMDNNKEQQQ